MTGNHTLRIVANVNNSDRHWTAWVDTTLTTSVRSLAEAVVRADRLGYDLEVQPEAYEEMVAAAVAEPGAAPGADWHDFIG